MDEHIREVAAFIPETLEGLVGFLKWAKKPWPQLVEEPAFPLVLKKMLAAVRATGEESLTPMAAVAGAFADLVADALVERGATKVIVNNGGDIALRLAPGEETRVGLSPRAGGAPPSHYLPLTHDHGVGGVTTSGLGGRSLTTGIADAVVVLGPNAAGADACSTLIANFTDVACPQIDREPAHRLYPGTDIPHLWVTVGVGRLPPWAMATALKKGQNKARELIEKGLISAAVIFVQGETAVWPPGLIPIPVPDSPD